MSLHSVDGQLWRTQVIRRFVFSSFARQEEEFKLPERDLEDDVTYPDDPVRKLTPETFDGKCTLCQRDCTGNAACQDDPFGKLWPKLVSVLFWRETGETMRPEVSIRVLTVMSL